MLKHLLTVADEMFGKQHGEFDIVFTEQIQQGLLSLNLREFAEISITPEEVEGVIDHPILPTGR
jgi:hypothetical protein